MPWSDMFHAMCLDLADYSDCQKLHFGSVVVKNGIILGAAYNKKQRQCDGLCDPVCVRLGMPSRQDALIGACEHAEQLAVWEAIAHGEDIRGATVYVAGKRLVAPIQVVDGVRLENHELFYREYTCLWCARFMARAGIAFVAWWTPEPREIPVEQAVREALQYAQGRVKA